jgi:hypothetical protein
MIDIGAFERYAAELEARFPFATVTFSPTPVPGGQRWSFTYRPVDALDATPLMHSWLSDDAIAQMPQGPSAEMRASVEGWMGNFARQRWVAA